MGQDRGGEEDGAGRTGTSWYVLDLKSSASCFSLVIFGISGF